jgi:hypothetical protein
MQRMPSSTLSTETRSSLPWIVASSLAVSLNGRKAVARDADVAEEVAVGERVQEVRHYRDAQMALRRALADHPEQLAVARQRAGGEVRVLQRRAQILRLLEGSTVSSAGRSAPGPGG